MRIEICIKEFCTVKTIPRKIILYNIVKKLILNKFYLRYSLGILCLNSDSHPFYIAISALCFAVALLYIILGFAVKLFFINFH